MTRDRNYIQLPVGALNLEGDAPAALSRGDLFAPLPDTGVSAPIQDVQQPNVPRLADYAQPHPDAPVKRGRGRPRKNPLPVVDEKPPSQEKRPPTFKIPALSFNIAGQRPLNDGEAGSYRQVLIEVWTELGNLANKAISATNRNRASCDVWEFQDDEVEALADAILALGKRSVVAAVATRQIVSGWSYYRVGLILGPRFISTVQFYANNGGFSLWVPMAPMNQEPLSWQPQQ